MPSDVGRAVDIAPDRPIEVPYKRLLSTISGESVSLPAPLGAAPRTPTSIKAPAVANTPEIPRIVFLFRSVGRNPFVLGERRECQSSFGTMRRLVNSRVCAVVATKVDLLTQRKVLSRILATVIGLHGAVESRR